MDKVMDSIGQLRSSRKFNWFNATELDALLEEEVAPEEIWWGTSRHDELHKLESVAQIPSILRMVREWGENYSFENDPMTKYAQGTKLVDGNYTLELAVVGHQACNIRIGYGADPDCLSSHPDADVEFEGPQSLSIAQVTEVLGQWLLGRGLPSGYGGSIHIYG